MHISNVKRIIRNNICQKTNFDSIDKLLNKMYMLLTNSDNKINKLYEYYNVEKCISA